jgi:hypothetical protein
MYIRLFPSNILMKDIPFEEIFSAADYPPRQIQPLASMLPLSSPIPIGGVEHSFTFHKCEGRERISTP